MSAVVADQTTRHADPSHARDFLVHSVARDESVVRADDNNRIGRRQRASALWRVELRRWETSPHDEVRWPYGSTRHPSGRRSYALREAKEHDPRCLANPAEHLARDGIEVSHVISDLVVAIFSRHPCRAHRSISGGRGLDVREIESIQCLRRSDESRTVIERCEYPDEIRRKLAVAVQHEPDFARTAIIGTESLVTGSPIDLDRVGQDGCWLLVVGYWSR